MYDGLFNPTGTASFSQVLIKLCLCYEDIAIDVNVIIKSVYSSSHCLVKQNTLCL